MIGPIKPFTSISHYDASPILDMFIYQEPLSGYLAGKERGGQHVVALEDAWAKEFHVKHAIACNSATSGLMAAAFAVGLKHGDEFLCPAMTMSATVAAPMFTGAKPHFADVTDDDFGLALAPLGVKAIFVTNLFGHPARLHKIRAFADDLRCPLIEDNSQSPFAMEGDKYAGTIGHIGVFSLNVHKPIQCGEGGVVTTDDDDLAKRLRNFINHGENTGDHIGLNLRMPEVCAAIALAQLRRGQWIAGDRTEQAKNIIKAIGDIPGIRPPTTRDGCWHVYYTIPFLIDCIDVGVGCVGAQTMITQLTRRERFCHELRNMGVPIVEGYAGGPLYRLPAFAKFARPCPVAEDLHDRRLFYFENCAYDPTPEQIEQIGAAFRKAAERVL